MDISKQYQQRLSSYIDEIKNSGKQVVIFGTGRAGWYIMKVLEFFDIPISAFSDNDSRKQTSYCNYQVRSPNDIAKEFHNAYVILGVFIPNTANIIKKQFHQLDLQHVHYDMEAFLFAFIVSVAGRKCDKRVLAESIHILFENYKEGAIHYGRTKEKYFVSPFVTSVITQKCSLRCRDCAQLIPYYKSPINFKIESIIDDLKQYSKAFDVVPEISLHGGEPFLHPDIKEICKGVAAIPNIVFISFITNGTILPAEDTLKQLSSCGADVHQSGGYGALSKKKAELAEAFSRHNIYSDILFCSPTEMWTRSTPYKQHFRDDTVNAELYKACVSTKTCCQIMNGELHRCALSMHGSHQGLFPKCENDFVRLHEPIMPEGAQIAKIRGFLDRDRAISVCDYCDPDGGTLVPPAIQLSRG